jgi:hypothetical protein
MLLNTSKALYVGNTPAKAVYLGDTKVWPAGGGGGDFGGTPFEVPATFATGYKVYADARFQSLDDKGFGVQSFNSQYLQGYANTQTLNGPAIDFSKPWGFQFWIRFHESGRDGVDHYAMLCNDRTARSSTAYRKNWLIYLEQRLGGSGYVSVQSDTNLGAKDPAASVRIGALGVLPREKWYLASVEVAEVTNAGSTWGGIRVRLDDQAGDVREIDYPGPIILPTTVVNSGSFSIMAGSPMYTDPSISWVPVAWKGTLI